MTEMEACIAAGTPGEAHKLLEPFAGTWKAEVRHWMEPGAEPQASTGKMTNTLTHGNRYLRQDYEGDGVSGGTFQGSGYWGFNNITQKYEGFWIDTMSTGMMTESGDYDEASRTWVMTGEAEYPTPGAKMVKKSVITVQDRDMYGFGSLQPRSLYPSHSSSAR